jgi:hypothetical protein
MSKKVIEEVYGSSDDDHGEGGSDGEYVNEKGEESEESEDGQEGEQDYEETNDTRTPATPTSSDSGASDDSFELPSVPTSASSETRNRPVTRQLKDGPRNKTKRWQQLKETRRPLRELKPRTKNLPVVWESEETNSNPHGPSEVVFEGVMPRGDIRFFIPANEYEMERAYIGTSRQYPVEKSQLLRQGKRLRAGDEKSLVGKEPSQLYVKNIAVARDDSVSVFGKLYDTNEMYIWPRTILNNAWGRGRTNMLLSFYLKRSGQRGLPRSKVDKKWMKVQQGNKDSDPDWFKEVKDRVRGERSDQNVTDMSSCNPQPSVVRLVKTRSWKA